MDSRADYKAVAKYKGITTTVTDLSIVSGQLYASSLDGYVRIFDLEDKTIHKKIYFNKPLYSLYVDEVVEQQEKGNRKIE